MPLKEPKQTWQNLAQKTNPKGLPYINPCSKDPNDSYILDNLGYEKARKEHVGLTMPPGELLSQRELQVIEKWVRCGAPYN
jgi:hypothetical protein